MLITKVKEIRMYKLIALDLDGTLTDKNKNFFLRNMYDYVNNEENWE